MARRFSSGIHSAVGCNKHDYAAHIMIGAPTPPPPPSNTAQATHKSGGFHTEQHSDYVDPWKEPETKTL
jgi:hypothetical protein